MSHSLNLRVYYEDTDLAGIVYYANYLKFIERGRSEWLRDLGVDQVDMKETEGRVFAVRRIEADYLRPASLHQLTAARVVVDQAVHRDGDTLFNARVTIACLDRTGRPVRLPPAVGSRLRQVRT